MIRLIPPSLEDIFVTRTAREDERASGTEAVHAAATNTTLLPQVVLRPGEVLFRKNDPGVDMFVVLSGSIAVTTDQEGKGTPVGRLDPGMGFGEMALIEPGKPRTLTAVATSETRLLQINRDVFFMARHADIDLVGAMFEVQSKRLRENLEARA